MRAAPVFRKPPRRPETLNLRRAKLATKPKYVTDVLNDGAKRAQYIARETMKEVKQRMGLL